MTQSIGLSRTELVRVSWKKFRGTNLNHRTRWVPLMVIREEKSIPGPIAPSKLVPRQLTTRLLAYDISSHGHIGPWAARPVDSSPHGQLSPWTALTPRTIRPMDSSRPMDNSPHGQLSFGQLVLWTALLWTARPMDSSPHGQFAPRVGCLVRKLFHSGRRLIRAVCENYDFLNDCISVTYQHF